MDRMQQQQDRQREQERQKEQERQRQQQDRLRQMERIRNYHDRSRGQRRATTYDPSDSGEEDPFPPEVEEHRGSASNYQSPRQRRDDRDRLRIRDHRKEDIRTRRLD